MQSLSYPDKLGNEEMNVHKVYRTRFLIPKEQYITSESAHILYGLTKD